MNLKSLKFFLALSLFGSTFVYQDSYAGNTTSTTFKTETKTTTKTESKHCHSYGESSPSKVVKFFENVADSIDDSIHNMQEKRDSAHKKVEMRAKLKKVEKKLDEVVTDDFCKDKIDLTELIDSPVLVEKSIREVEKAELVKAISYRGYYKTDDWYFDTLALKLTLKEELGKVKITSSLGSYWKDGTIAPSKTIYVPIDPSSCELFDSFRLGAINHFHGKEKLNHKYPVIYSTDSSNLFEILESIGDGKYKMKSSPETIVKTIPYLRITTHH